MEIPQKNENGGAIWYCNPTAGHIPREKHYLKRYMPPPTNVHCSTINNSQDPEPPKYPSINELIKMWHTYTIAYYSAIKRRNNAIFSNVDGLRGYPTKWNKSGRDKYHMTSLTCGIYNDTNEQTENILWLKEGGEWREQWRGRWWLANAHCDIQNG